MKKIGLDHFNYLTDDFGIWQHTIGDEIDRKMGYALDDSARGLILSSVLKLKEESRIFLDYIKRSINNDCNFFDHLRSPINFPISDDALGQSFWAASLCLENSICSENAALTLRIIEHKVKEIYSLRGKCYTILGAVLTDKPLAQYLIDQLKKDYKKIANPNWPWIENALTYGNPIIPYAFLRAAKFLRDPEAQQNGLEMLNFINRETKHNGIPIAIGNSNWYFQGSEKSLYDQQPIDPAYQVLANISAYELTQDNNFLDNANLYFEWFWGKNIAQLPLIDINDHSCKDGIMASGLSKNKGAENIVCYLIAQAELERISANFSEAQS
jgi:hypothetical protein